MLSSSKRALFWMLVCCASITLGACGGGGDNAVPAPALAPATATATATAAVPVLVPPSGSLVSVSGIVRYERVAINSNTGALDYGSISALPVRGASVELIDSGAVYATAQTDAIGQYSFNAVPGSSSYSIRVRAELKQNMGAAQWDVSVRDNTNADALYTLQSPSFQAATAPTQNLTAASGWSGSSYTSARAAAPFAILDTIYASQQKVLLAQSNIVFPPLKTFWSINNNTTGGSSVAAGDIGTSFFTQASINGVVTDRRMYILGRADNDTDEYDSPVVAHEWGHYYQSAFSRDDSMGGRHGGGDDRLDRRIAFSEGWGNAWSGIALSRNSYVDSSGPSQGRGFAFPLDSGYASGGPRDPKGWFREASVQYILWSLNNQAGFQGIHQALSSSAIRTGTALTDIHSFSAAYRSLAGATPTSALNDLLALESIDNNSDAFGSLEANSGGNAVTLPFYRQITALGSPVALANGQTLCSTVDNVNPNRRSSANPSDADRNKLGLFVYARFTLATAASRTITVTGSPIAGVDVDFELYRAAQRVYVSQTRANQTESRTQSLAAGDYVLVIHDYNKAASNPCYTVSIQ
jgi:hypothetical protein